MNNKLSSSSVWVVIPAAGVGKRMKADRPKQYLSLLGKTVIENTLSCFSSVNNIAGIIVSLHPNDPYWSDIKLNISIPLYVVDGGKERSDSVLNALKYMQNELSVDDSRWVMVHDAARPCLLQEDIEKLISNCIGLDVIGGILAKKSSDTMKRSQLGKNEESFIASTEDRENLWHALTPQMFRLKELSDALAYALDKNIVITDEASALEAIGKSPLLVEATGSNIKITNPDDLALAEFLLSNNKGNT